MGSWQPSSSACPGLAARCRPSRAPCGAGGGPGACSAGEPHPSRRCLVLREEPLDGLAFPIQWHGARDLDDASSSPPPCSPRTCTCHPGVLAVLTVASGPGGGFLSSLSLSSLTRMIKAIARPPCSVGHGKRRAGGPASQAVHRRRHRVLRKEQIDQRVCPRAGPVAVKVKFGVIRFVLVGIADCGGGADIKAEIEDDDERSKLKQCDRRGQLRGRPRVLGKELKPLTQP